MKKAILFLWLTCLVVADSFGQAEGNNWYFGSYAGLSFTTNPPTILNDGHLTTSEGCATVSSKAGVLLFYTDGSNVWDANHVLMPNGTGLTGNPSSTMSAVICPKPGTYNYSLKRFDGYFIVTIDYVLGPNGVRFSEVDMTLNGGTGDVLAGNKNTLLFGTTTVEAANVARHANGCDYWIIGKEVGNTIFNVYAITTAGVNLTPVVSNVGSVTSQGWGNIKVSANNKLVAHSSPSIGTEVFDFNNNTGVLIYKFGDNAGGYSLEFSADNNILYSEILNDPNIYQFDLTSPNNAAFQASKTIIGTTANTIGYRMCALQMAPNGKIYAALQGLNYIGRIDFPNVLGVGCNYVDNGQSIAGVNTFSGTNMSSRLGLPAFPSFFITEPVTVVANNLCYQDLTQFQLSDTTDVDLVEWTMLDINLNLLTQSTLFEPTYQFADSGQYIISAIVHYPCYIDSFVIDTITIIDVAPVNLGTDTLLCVGDTITLDAGAGYDYYIWSTGDTVPKTSVTVSGQYIVQVMMQSDDSLCVKSDTINIAAFPIPTADFTATNECLGTPTVFTDVSNPNGGTVTNWEWDFDNNGTVDTNAQNPTHTFPSAGTFPVNLNTSSAGGVCSHDTTINIVVNAVPASNFGFADVCTNDASTFSDSSTISSGTIVSYTWDFGDGPPAGTSTQQSPTYVFTAPGTFIVILTVTSDSGCVDVQGKSIEVFPLPAPAFAAPDVCLYDDAVFTDASVISSGTISSWQWDFGDLSSSTAQNPTHLYSADNTYNVSLIVTSDNGCVDTLIQTIDIFPVPVSAFNTNNVCLYDPAVFSDASTITSGNIVGWLWDFDDGSASTVQNPSYAYSSDGTYSVSLVVLSDNGCVDTVMQTLTIYPVPLANFVTPNECLNDPATFTDATSINTPGMWNTWNWDFGDGVGTSAVQNPSYTYTTDSTFNVTFTVTSDDGCVDDTIISIVIYPLPTVDFSVDTASGCETLCVNFTDLSYITSGSINTWAWDFDDGNASAVQNSQNCYTAIDENTSRVASVTLISTSAFGCSETLTKGGMINIWPQPISMFTVGPQPTSILAPVIDYMDQSLGGIVSWEWGFGDGDMLFGVDSAAANPSHLYKDTGTYTVEQIIINQFACSDTSYSSVIIGPGSIVHVPNSFTPNGDGINDAFIPRGVGFDAQKFEMHIYNRWGDLVYKTTDIDFPWDGKGNNGNKIAQADVYIWMILDTNMQGEKHTSIGHVTLIR